MQPVIYHLLQSSVYNLSKFNNSQVKIFNIPLWNGRINITFIPKQGNYGNTSVILPSGGSITDENQSLVSHADNQNSYIAETRRLDEYFNINQTIFFLKIDVEGAEWEVLQGFHSHIENKKVLHLVLELRPGQEGLLRYLYQNDFRCRLYNRHSKTGCKGIGRLNNANHSSSSKAARLCIWNTFPAALRSLRKLVLFRVKNYRGTDYIDVYCSLKNRTRDNIRSFKINLGGNL